MTTTETIRRGIKRRIADMDSSYNRTARSADLHPNTVRNFVIGESDMVSGTLFKFIEDGLGTTLQAILKLGSK